MSNLNDGFGQERNQDADDMSPLSWRTSEADRNNQHPSVERLSFPLGDDEPAREYAYSLKALNVAFGCFPQSSSVHAAPSAASTEFPGSQINANATLTAIPPPNECLRQMGPLSAAKLWQHQQPMMPTLKLLEESSSGLTQAFGPPTGINGANCETRDNQGHVQGMFGSKKAKTLLPKDFKPSSNSVILGRGRCSESIGNRRFKVVVQNHLEEYLAAPGKLEKTFIVSKVLHIIEQSCPVGAFVKYENGRWWSAGERASREKIGASFRDALHTLYKSSSKSKVAKRKARAQAEKKLPPQTEETGGTLKSNN